ncbi:MAG: hypothetical protein COV48_02710 [Elusimicrobia bacterium CG11_big_fil_rev_8_21_14_0_20_64_6]|nr:MAG: hypothetical protein COV48_02710 [Elusimicrobia bacterium CG11_big_fil_rev_8_21_14_0_20_64_6]
MLSNQYQRLAKSEKGSSHVGMLFLMFLALAIPFVGIALLFMGYKLYVYYAASPDERAEMPWWPREFVTGQFLSFASFIAAFLIIIFSGGDPTQTRPIAGIFIMLPFVYFLIGTPMALVQWRRKLPELASIWAVWAINTGLVIFGMLYVAIIAFVYSQS